MLSPWKHFAQAVGLSAPDARAEDPLFDRRSIEVLARIAHEARQPLSAARAAFELIRRSPDNARRQRAYVVVDRQFARLTRLFDDLLDAGRLHIGNTTLCVESIDLRRLVEDATESVRPQVEDKRQRLAIQLPDDSLWMDADSVRLQQVVSNLLVNGIKYTDPGGQVSVALAHPPGDAVLTVSDTGRGIRPEVLPHIFEPFVRGDAASEPGLGVGLTIAQQLVELHGGTIRASSAGLGQGSQFVVTLPARSSTHRRMRLGEVAAALALIPTSHLRP
jgi:signal transduction histidine kinase